MRARTAVLLGAGASVDAGLLQTVQLAEEIVERANRPGGYGGRPDWVSALNFVYGSMVGFQAEDGGDPLQAVNIERLISALRLLQSVSDHEVAPFVSTWKPGALGVGAAVVDRSMGDSVFSAIDSGLMSRTFGRGELADAIAQIARKATTTGNPEAFRVAERKILEGLSEVLGSLESVDYLAPLAALANEQVGGLDVITLNYDLAVEQMASDTGTSIERGIETWRPGIPMKLRSIDGQINLLKLHGSLDWVEQQPGGAMAAPVIEVASEPTGLNRPSTKPWIVVGDREKLATDGPTLALLRAAEDALQRATHLVVVGYSFGDAHVNSLIRNWMLSRVDRTIGIVDVHWDGESLGAFRTALIHAYGADARSGRESRVVPIPGKTKDVLQEALQRLPAKTPTTAYATVTSINSEADLIRISMVLNGPDLHSTHAHVQVLSSDPRRGQQHVQTFGRAENVNRKPPGPSGSSWVAATFDHWVCGSEVDVFILGPLPTGATISVRGSRLDSSTAVAFQVDLNS